MRAASSHFAAVLPAPTQQSPKGCRHGPPTQKCLLLACLPVLACGDRDVHRLLFERDSCVQVAEAALCVLSTLLLTTKMRADTKRMLCHAVVVSQLHQALLAFLRTSPRSSGACKVHSWYPSLGVEPVEFAAMQGCRLHLSSRLLTMNALQH